MRPALLVLAASVVGLRFSSLPQKPTVPRYTLQEEWRIAQTENVKDVGFIRFAPNGNMIVAPFNGGNAEIVALDSAGKKSLWRVPTGWSDRNEIQGIQRMGFSGATLWVSDRNFHQVALINEKGKVTKSLEHPSFVRPLMSERKKYPVFGSLEALAVYADGTWLVRPYREHDFVDTPEFDSTSVHLFRISESGVIQRVVAKYPEDPIIEINESGRNMRMSVYFGNRALFDVSQDGMRIAIVTAALSGKDSATYRMTTYNERGDTVFAKRFPFTAQLISATARDSALRRNDFPAMKAQQAAQMPAIHTPVTDVLIGRDRTTWLRLRPGASDTTVTLLMLDGRGEQAATVTVSNTINVLMADKGHVWGVERLKGNLRIVARYKLVPAR